MSRHSSVYPPDEAHAAYEREQSRTHYDNADFNDVPAVDEKREVGVVAHKGHQIKVIKRTRPSSVMYTAAICWPNGKTTATGVNYSMPAKALDDAMGEIDRALDDARDVRAERFDGLE